jgi:hypothetical protein
MEYHLEIYRPGSGANDGCIKTFTAATPFFPIRGGEVIKTKTWAVEWPVLRVVNVEHVISESSRGIDPSGAIIFGSCFIPKVCRIPLKRGVD